MELLPLGDHRRYHRLAHHPDLWKPLKGPMFVLKTTWADGLRELYELIAPRVQQGKTLLVAHPLDLASRVLQDEGKATAATLHLAPIGLRSLHQTPQMPGVWLSEHAPRWVRRLQYWAGDTLVIDPLVCPTLNRFRQEKGLPPVRRVLKGWYMSPELVVGLFPDWFAPVQPDWPPQFVPTGFPLWDHIGDDVMPAEVEEFLDAGDAPLVFAPGSAMRRGEGFFAAAAEACRRLGRRGDLPDRLPQATPERPPRGGCPLRLRPAEPASAPFGGTGASRRHRHPVAGAGGRGSAGRFPMAFDQLDNGTRIVRLEVGEVIKRSRLTADRLTRRLDHLLENPAVKDACEAVREKVAAANGLAMVCDALEQLAERRGLAQ